MAPREIEVSHCFYAGVELVPSCVRLVCLAIDEDLHLLWCENIFVGIEMRPDEPVINIWQVDAMDLPLELKPLLLYFVVEGSLIDQRFEHGQYRLGDFGALFVSLHLLFTTGLKFFFYHLNSIMIYDLKGILL